MYIITFLNTRNHTSVDVWEYCYATMHEKQHILLICKIKTWITIFWGYFLGVAETLHQSTVWQARLLYGALQLYSLFPTTKWDYSGGTPLKSGFQLGKWEKPLQPKQPSATKTAELGMT